MPFNLFSKPSDGTGELTTLLDSAAAGVPVNWKQPTSWSPDGRLLVFEVLDPQTGPAIPTLSLPEPQGHTVD